MSPATPHNGVRISQLISAGFVIAGLYFAREILLPLALAVLLSFLLAPLATKLERWRLGRVPSTLVVVTLALALVGGLGWLVTDQIVQMTAELPAYKEHLQKRIEVLRSDVGGPLARAREAVNELEAEINKPAPKAAHDVNASEPIGDGALPLPAPAGSAGRGWFDRSNAVPVRVVDTGSYLSGAFTWLIALLGPLGTAAIVALLVLFILLEREDLRNRVVMLVGRSHLAITTKAIDDATGRVGRYLRMQLLINATYGVAVGVMVLAVGLPNALFWAIAGMSLRFIPYIGPWFTAGGITLTALAVTDGWTQPLLVIGIISVLELVVNNVLEPWLYGASTGVSPVGIVISAIFWTWLWGGVGLFLATPLTVCLTVLGRYVRQLEFLAVLLSDDPPLPPESRFYQRLLALDNEEAREAIQDTLTKQGLVAVYDDVLMPTLNLAESDYLLGELEDHQRSLVHNSVLQAAEDACFAEEEIRAANSEDDAKAQLTINRTPRRVLIAPAHGAADQIASRLLATWFEMSGWDARESSDAALAGEVLTEIDEFAPDLVVISSFPAFSRTQARYLCKRIRQRFDTLRVVVGSWTRAADGPFPDKLLRGEGASAVVASLEELTAWVEVTFPNNQISPLSDRPVSIAAAAH